MMNKRLSSLMAKIDSKRYLVLGLLFILALVIRIYFTIDEFNTNGTSKWADATLYLANGREFARGNFYPLSGEAGFTIVGPVMPLLVAGSLRLFGDPIWPLLILNCLLSAAMVLVLFSLGKRLVSVAAGYFMALWSVFNFGLIRMNFQIIKEPLVIFLLPLILLCLLRVWDRRKPYLHLFGSALMFSLLVHADERYIVYAPFILVAVFFSARWREGLLRSMLWLLVLGLTMIPWTLRNHHQHNELVILTPRTTAVTSIIWGTNLARLHFSQEDGLAGHPRYQEALAEASSRAGAAGVEFRLYGRYEKFWKAWLHYWKPAYFRLTFIQYGFRPVQWSLAHNLSSLIFYGIYLPLFVAGLFFALLRRNWMTLCLAALPVFHSLLHTLMIWPLERYRLPLDFIIVLVAVGLVRELAQARQNNSMGSTGARVNL